MEALAPLRDGIDRIDRQLIDLLVERYQLAAQIGKYKQEHNLPFFVPEREASLRQKLHEYNRNRLDNATLDAIYREIISGAIRCEHPLKIAFLGPLGTFSHQAVIQKFGHGVELHPSASIPGVFQQIESNQADYGCVPVENTTEGVVNPTLDALRESDLEINAEFFCRIEHHLLSSVTLPEIKTVYSHAQILGQCRRFLQERLPHAQLTECASSVKALEFATLDPSGAAIVSRAAVKQSKLHVVAENIEDSAANKTRFLIIGRQRTKPTGNDKTAVCFALADRPGALYDALQPLHDRGISMSMIESRPFLSTGQYCFFADLAGHQEEEKIRECCKELQQKSTFFKILGSFPVA